MKVKIGDDEGTGQDDKEAHKEGLDTNVLIKRNFLKRNMRRNN